MPSDIDDDDPPLTHAIADGWAHFAETIMPGIGGAECVPQAHVAFYFGAMHVLQLVGQVVEHRSTEAAALALSMLDAEIDEFIEVQGVSTQ